MRVELLLFEQSGNQSLCYGLLKRMEKTETVILGKKMDGLCRKRG